MPVSEEQMIDVGRGITLCADQLGDPTDPPLLLIAGLGMQMIRWPEGFCEQLVAQGFHVVRFDNRDAGRSTHPDFRPPTLAQLTTGRFADQQYTLSDMAADTAALIDALELRPAHLVGVSMGGMIAQMIAALHPEHVRSLVSIMSTTGARRVGWAAPSTLRLMFRRPPRTREEAARRAVMMWRHIGSHGYPFDEVTVRELALCAFDRDPAGPAGTGRQLGAIRSAADRTDDLRRIAAPTLVIHGDRDRMVHPSGGRATAAAIPGARLETVAGMGHDLPEGAWEKLVGLIADHAHRADRLLAPAGELTG